MAMTLVSMQEARKRCLKTRYLLPSLDTSSVTHNRNPPSSPLKLRGGIEGGCQFSLFEGRLAVMKHYFSNKRTWSIQTVPAMNRSNLSVFSLLTLTIPPCNSEGVRKRISSSLHG